MHLLLLMLDLELLDRGLSSLLVLLTLVGIHLGVALLPAERRYPPIDLVHLPVRMRAEASGEGGARVGEGER